MQLQTQNARLDQRRTDAFTYVYLCSAPHSGSTLIACLLGAHPEISTVGEYGSDVPVSGKCSCGSTYAECPFWQNWSEMARQAGIDFKVGQLDIDARPPANAEWMDDLFHYLSPFRSLDAVRDLCFAACTNYVQRMASRIEKSIDLAGILCAHEGSRVFLDTTKNARQIPWLVRQRKVPVKVIALVRDGRGVALSLVEKENLTFRRAVEGWIWCNRNLRRAVRYVRREDVFWLRLEDLCERSEKVIPSLLEFCGVNADQEMDWNRPGERHLIGNGMRHRFNGAIRRDERWRELLTRSELEYFERRAGWLNRIYGYESTPR